MKTTDFLEQAKAKYKAKIESVKNGVDWVSEMNFIYSDKLILRVWFDVNFEPNTMRGETGFMHKWCSVETL